MKSIWFNSGSYSRDWASLVMRVVFGGLMLLVHGLGKLEMMQQQPVQFINFLGIGAEASLMLVAFAEFVCAIFVVAGLGTRLALIPLLIDMIVAIAMVHLGQPIAKAELAIIYLSAFSVIFILGSGKYSFDYLLSMDDRKEMEIKR